MPIAGLRNAAEANDVSRRLASTPTAGMGTRANTAIATNLIDISIATSRRGDVFMCMALISVVRLVWTRKYNILLHVHQELLTRPDDERRLTVEIALR